MSWRILATQTLIVHVLEDSWNTSTYGTLPGKFWQLWYFQCISWRILATQVLTVQVRSILQHRYLKYISWRIFATQLLKVHVLEDSCNTGSYSTCLGEFLQHRYYSTCPAGFLEHRYFWYISLRILATKVLPVHILEDSSNAGTHSTWPGGFLQHRYLQNNNKATCPIKTFQAIL